MMNIPQHEELTVVCHECDALQKVANVAVGKTAVCMCCGSKLFKNHKGGIDRPLALIIACMILFIFANIYPVMQLTIAGIESETTLIGAAYIFLQQGSPELAITVLSFSVLIPGFCIVGLFYVLFSIRYNLNLKFTKPLMVWVSRLLPWGMMDVFLLAVLVALVKLVALADVILGIGFVAFVSLIICYAGAISSFDTQLLWISLDNNRADDINE